ncbi:methyltransferase domain-containing protein [Aquincola sp. MAHUQ-54]|uniref:Methyltransferase domain-containing protein n=1 Tax=Aquincola agrisoli TaxID=3119538 RepID=A0AAW9QA45_9BURK
MNARQAFDPGAAPRGAPPAAPARRRLRMLVAIACYGERNLPLLRWVIAGYRAMSLSVDVVVLSDAPKDLGPDVRVVVGLPSKNPWSLPFAHKRLFVEQAEAYDLFAYSEDDMEVLQRHVDAFLRISPLLADDEIAGFLRYEVDREGGVWLPEAHGSFHWKPASVQRRGSETVAEFSNEHAAFFLLTRAQLRRAIDSGGFDRAPAEGRYDMLCTAATDPYTRCGMRKVVCVSALDDFLIHHLSDRYAGQLGMSLPAAQQEVRTLLAIGRGEHPATRLLAGETTIDQGEWAKAYHTRRPAGGAAPAPECLPGGARSVLSIGCGDGEAEAAWVARGVRVTALPLDAVVGAGASARGVEVLYGPLEEGLARLAGRRFDCVVASDLLHLVPQPQAVLAQCVALLAPGGTLLLEGPHFGTLRLWARRLLGRGEARLLRSYQESGVHTVGPRVLRRLLRREALQVALRWSGGGRGARWCPGWLRPWMSPRWALQARR